jgi:hypothetical protein
VTNDDALRGFSLQKEKGFLRGTATIFCGALREQA